MRFKSKFIFILMISFIFMFVGCASSEKKNIDTPNKDTKCVETKNDSANINDSEKNFSSNTAQETTSENKTSNSNTNINFTKPASSTKKSNAKKSTSNKSIPNNSKNTSQNKTIKMIGFVGKVYDKGGKRYLTFDNVKFFTGKAAVEAAKKEGKAYKDEKGNYYVYDDYYIVNPNKQFKTYRISENATFNLCVYLLNSPGKYSNASITSKTTYSKFKSSANNSSILCYITVKNNEIINVTQQYIP